MKVVGISEEQSQNQFSLVCFCGQSVEIENSMKMMYDMYYTRDIE